MKPSAAVAARVRQQREARGMTREDFAALCARRGYPELTYGSLTNIERAGRSDRGRATSVDELVALADVLGVTPGSLLGSEPCSACQGNPPPGFTCNTCGGAR